MIDASFVNVPIHRNSRNENPLIKSAVTPPKWEEEDATHKLAQKNVDAL